MIENIKILPDSLHVKFTNNIDDNFPNIWLRDHAKDHENWDQRIQISIWIIETSKKMCY